MPDPDPLAVELEVYIKEIEARRDPDDNEIEAYARMKSRVENDRIALDARFERELKAMSASHESMLKEIDRHDDAIEWKYGQFVREKVAGKIAGQKQRSVKTLFGVVGYRKTAGKVVRHVRLSTDKETLLEWAKRVCPKAVVTKQHESVDADMLPVTCEHIYDETVPESDNFYWKPAKVEENKDV